MISDLSQIPNNETYDVVVVGAGMVGASAALGFAQIGKSVLLLEAFALKSPQPDYTPSYDARSTALSWGSREILGQLGVWSAVALHACPINKVHVSQKGRFGTTCMTADEVGHDALGYVVPNQWLGQSLLSEISDQSITLCAPAKVKGIALDGGQSYLEIESEGLIKKVSASLLVVSDGSGSETSKLLGISHRTENYGQHALIANVTTELANDGVAYERFTPAGPLALLPLSEQESALVWTHDESRIEEMMSLSDEAFCQALSEQFGERMGRVLKVGERNTYPLKLVQAEEQIRPGIVLLGNAAHSLHPVAGQGFNLALRGVAALVDQVRKHSSMSDALRAYQVQQSSDQKRTIVASDQLVKVFGQQSVLLAMARDLGLIGLNNLSFVKQAFARTAMGLAGQKPEIVAQKGEFS